MEPTIRLRPAGEADYRWLRWLHHVAFRDTVEQMWGWDEAEQDARFHQGFDPAARQIIEVDRCDVGVIGVERRPGEIFLSDIEIAPEHQGRGIGTRLIQEIQEQARHDGLPVALQVIRTNRARGLYERLGFVVTAETATHYHMRWCP